MSLEEIFKHPQGQHSQSDHAGKGKSSKSKLVDSWKKLNKKHIEINRFFNKVYGGPDVNESYFSKQPKPIAQKSRKYFEEREKISNQKQALERKMSDEEFEQTL